MTPNGTFRIDFIGGWSDQELWTEPAAVLNAAVRIPDPIEGIGTGLGLSSIRIAREWLKTHEKAGYNYVLASVDAERENGAKGGWQDALGGIEPGFKLITTNDHAHFDVKTINYHPIMDHIVLFDTGIRRNSQVIGDKIRSLLEETNPTFYSWIYGAVKDAKCLFYNTRPDVFMELCMSRWLELLSYFPEMNVDVPTSEDCYGYKLCGAGGGGYGIMFVKTPEAREDVIKMLAVYGMKSWIPELVV